MVRSVAQNDTMSMSQRSSQNTPTPWDNHSSRPAPSRSEDHDFSQRDGRASANRDSRGSQRERIERLVPVQPQQQPQPQPQQHQHQNQHQHHVRNGSGTASSGDYAEAQNGTGRRHDYDVHAMETDLHSPRTSSTKNPIPPPVVTVRSEFPTLNRSRQQQSLTCLVTIEVPEGKWHPSPHDLQHAPITATASQDDAYSSIQSPVRPAQNHNEVSEEELAALEETTEELKVRVDNWHGLEFERQLSPSGYHLASADQKIGSANCAFMALFVSAKIFNLGRNLSATYLMKCSSVLKRRRAHNPKLWKTTRNGI